jgi:hypothetical protein
MKMETGMKRATDGVAGLGLIMPAWLPKLETASVVAGYLVPILSAIWLALQIGRFLLSWWSKRDAEE